MPTRIIPAGAGHFAINRRRRTHRPDHPRRCGAFRALPRLPYRAMGSSPQVRGIWQWVWENSGKLGIIPAGAGHFLA